MGSVARTKNRSGSLSGAIAPDSPWRARGKGQNSAVQKLRDSKGVLTKVAPTEEGTPLLYFVALASGRNWPHTEAVTAGVRYQAIRLPRVGSRSPPKAPQAPYLWPDRFA